MSETIAENNAPKRTFADASLVKSVALPNADTVTESIDLKTAANKQRLEGVEIVLQIQVPAGDSGPGAGSLAVDIGHGTSGSPRSTLLLDAEAIGNADVGPLGYRVAVPLPDLGTDTYIGLSITATGDWSSYTAEFGVAT